MADNVLTNPHPEMRNGPDYIKSRLIAAFWYVGDHEPTQGDFDYFMGVMASKNDGWSGYWWDKIVTVGGDGVTPRPVVNPDPVDPSVGVYHAGPNPFHPVVPTVPDVPVHVPPLEPEAIDIPDLLTKSDIAELVKAVNALTASLNKPPVSYIGSVFGVKVVLRPV